MAVSFTGNSTSALDLTEVVETYAKLLFRVANSVLRSPTEAEDVVQDVFLRLLEHRNTLDQVRDIRLWLVKIAWNRALDRKRKKRPDQLDEAFAQSLASETMPADTAMEEAHRYATVLKEIERLPKPERHALLLSAVEELSTNEIATILGRSESAVRALLSRARARLRERLQGGNP